MLNWCKRLFIIVTCQLLMPVLLVLVISSVFLQANIDLSNVQSILSKYQNIIMILHALFYLGLIGFWPKLINFIINSNGIKDISQQQLQMALHSKWYLLGIFLFFDLLFAWR